jgi:glycosyltransferase involved in cell wall biosynthesis
MKVALIGPVFPYRGGIAHYTTQLFLGLQAQGHACKVISFRRQYPSWLYPGDSDKDPSQSVTRIEAEYLIDPFYPWTWQQCGRRIYEITPDLVVFQWWTTYWTLSFAYLAYMCRRQGMPVVFLVHNVLPHEEKPWDRPMVKLALSQSDGFVVQTQREAERLRSLFSHAKIGVSPHPAYTMLTDRRIDQVQARQILGLPIDRTILLFFGIVRPYKGLMYLIEALSFLKSEGLTPYLIIAGDFWEGRSLYARQIERYGLTDQIMVDDRYIPDEQAAIIFSAADVLVAPYVGGTQSGVASIALGFGMPMILTEQIASGLSENVPEMVKIVAPGDAVALAKAIQSIMVEPISTHAKPQETKDNWSKFVSSLELLHDRILKERHCA